MKIAINGRFLTQNVTGVQRYSIEIVQEIDRIMEGNDAYEIDLLVPRNASLITNLSLKNIRVVRFGRGSGHLWEQLMLPWYRFDMLACLGNTAPLLSLIRKKVLAVVHDLSYKYFPEAYSTPFRLWYGFLIPFVLKWSRLLFTVSNSEKAAIESHYPAIRGKVKVGPCGGFTREILDEIESGEINTSSKRKQFIYVGSLNPRKNLKGFLKAFTQIHDTYDFDAIIIGGGEKAFADYGLKEYQNSDRIKFLGHINDPRIIARHLGESYALVFPTYYEASPIPPIEAMNSNCAVIASDIDANIERCGEAALYCKADDLQSIVNAMIELIKDPNLQREYLQRGKQNSRKFTWQNTAEILWSEIRALNEEK